MKANGLRWINVYSFKFILTPKRWRLSLTRTHMANLIMWCDVYFERCTFIFLRCFAEPLSRQPFNHEIAMLNFILFKAQAALKSQVHLCTYTHSLSFFLSLSYTHTHTHRPIFIYAGYFTAAVTDYLGKFHEWLSLSQYNQNWRSIGIL